MQTDSTRNLQNSSGNLLQIPKLKRLQFFSSLAIVILMLLVGQHPLDKAVAI